MGALIQWRAPSRFACGIAVLVVLALLALAALLAGDARACGIAAPPGYTTSILPGSIGGGPQPTVAPDAQDILPYLAVEQALIAYDGESKMEDFVREARFERADKAFGFIVPLPSKPELVQVEKSPFAQLRGAFPFEEDSGIGGLGGLGSGADRSGIIGLGGAGGAGGVTTAAPAGMASDPIAPTLDILAEQRVGSFTAFTLAANDAASLKGWLDQNGFQLTDSLRAWLDHYVRMHFHFVAFRYEPPAATDGGAVSAGMTSETVRIRFATPAPYFPYSEPSRAKESTSPRMFAMWFVARDAMTPVASSKSDAADPAWAQPWRAGAKYAPSSDFLKSVVKTLSPIVPTSTASLALQTYRDHKPNRAGFGDVLLVPSKPTKLDATAVDARRDLFAVLDRALEPAPTPQATLPIASSEPSAAPASSAPPIPAPSASASPASRGCSVGPSANGASFVAIASALAMAALVRARRRRASIAFAALAAVSGLACSRASTTTENAPSITSAASAITSVAPSASPSSSASSSPDPSTIASASIDAAAPIATLDSDARAKREAAIVELLSGQRSATLPVLAGFAPTPPDPGRRMQRFTVKVREMRTEVNGPMAPEIVRRVLRQNYGRYRHCYEMGLARNPDLAGNVAWRFIVDRAGNIASVTNIGSTINDASVVQCVMLATHNLTFPEPDAGVVVVTTALHFENSAQ